MSQHPPFAAADTTSAASHRAARRRVLPAVLIALGLITALPCRAQTGWQPDAVFGEIGVGEHDAAATLGPTWDGPAWAWFGHPVRLYWELALSRWRAQAAHGMPSQWATRLGITPVLRVPLGAEGRYFAEGGIGLNFITPHYRSDDEVFSTHFNFGDHLGVGIAFGPARSQELALRVQHFSNASIRMPNPGVNFIELRYSVRLGTP